METADAVLSFWFDGDQAENFRCKWFPPDGSDKQQAMDREVRERFGTLLAQAERRELDHWRHARDSTVALILVLDQFSRHVYRITSDNDPENEKRAKQRAENDAYAFELANEVLSKQWHVDMAVPHFVFVMMPVRHSPTAASLQVLLQTIDERKQLQQQHADLLEKFRRTTTNRLMHLRGDEHAPGDATDANVTTGISDDDILERAFMETDESDMPRNRLYRAMHEYLVKMRAREYSHLAVSLSGGVDSMVVAYLLHRLRSLHNNFEIAAVHIDYGNRDESAAECNYVRRWCERFGIIFHVRRIDEVKRATTKRDDYEKISREIRYETYANVMRQYGAPGMCFGHHRGDVQENVISNMMKGLSLLNLNGMSASSVVNGVRIWRPLLDFDKDAIFEFAHRYGVPYFKDTTPKWSTRGKLRNQLVPLLRDMYGDGFLNNLSTLGAESTQCSELIESSIMAPIMASVRTSEVAVWLNCSLLTPQPFFVWKEVFRSVCHNIMGNSMVREKPIRELTAKLARFSGESGSWVTLKKGNRSYLTPDRQLIIFRDRFFPLRQPPYAPPQTLIEPGETYEFGPWTVETQLVDEDSEVVKSLRSRAPFQLWDLVQGDGLEYAFPNAPQLVIDCDSRLPVLRALDKVITDVMPIVSSVGSFDEGEGGDDGDDWKKWVHVTLAYHN